MIEFWKISGAGNDFIVVSNTGGSLDGILTDDFIRGICTRRLSIGADGLIELLSDDDHPFRMKYYNSDGRPAPMCGNGARCISIFAERMGLVDRSAPFMFCSDAGVHRAMITGDNSSRIWLTEPRVHFLDRKIDYGGRHCVSFVDSGVPHAVIFTDEPDDPEFEVLAPVVRSHEVFGSPGANANYAFLESASDIILRTFERGVEGETLACGTGAVAVTVCGEMLFPDRISLPVRVHVRSGLVLMVGMDEYGWWVSGESRIVYRGVLENPLEA